TYKRGLATVEEQLVTYKKNEVLFSKEVAVLKREVACKDYEINVLKNDSKENSDDSFIKNEYQKKQVALLSLHLMLIKTAFSVDKKIEFVKPKNYDKPVRRSVRYAEMYRSQRTRGNQRNWNGQKSNQLGSDFVMYNKACFICGSFGHVHIIYTHHQRKRRVSGNNYNRVDYNYYTKTTHPSAQRNMTPRAVLLKTGLRPFNTAKPVYTTHPNQTVNSARPMTHFSKQAQSTVQRPFYKQTTFTNRYFHQKANTARPRVVYTARPYIAQVNTVRAKRIDTVKASACWVWRPTRPNGALLGKPQNDDKGFIDSVCSWHMTGNIAYLLDFKEFDEGYVTFRGGAHGGRISVKADSKLPTTFRAEAVSTACYVQNRVLIVKPHNKTPYELFRGFKPAQSFMRLFICHATIPNTFDNLGKFDGKSDESFFVGYSLSSKAFRVYNTRTRKVEKNLHIEFLENKPIIEGNGPKWLFDTDFLTQSMNYVPVAVGIILDESVGIQGDLNAGISSGNEATSQDYIVMPIWKDASYFDTPSKDVGDVTHNEDDDKDKSKDDSSPKEVNAAGQHTKGMTNPTSKKGFLSVVYEEKTHVTMNNCLYACFLSQIEPTSIAKALSDSFWVEAMQEELMKFKLQQSHRQEEGIEYEEVFAPVAIIEAIRLFLAYASFMGFLVYQMDVKSAFLYRTIKEEVYVTQPPGFKDPTHLDKVYKVVKALYGLHQAPRAWYDTLANYMLSNVFQKGKVDPILFIKKQKGDILLVQIHVDDIIFGSTNKELCTAFEKLMKDKFQMNVKSASTPVDLEKPLVKDRDANDVDVHLYRSMIGSLMYLITSRPDIMFVVCACEISSYTKDTPSLSFAYTDNDYAGETQGRKSTTEGWQFLENRLISWQCKKQTVVATSTTEAEYVATASCCGQVL
nr:hypothetical protein [Tanacetum cinerariifolium]